MERDALLRKTLNNIERLPTTHIQEVNDLMEFIINKNDDSLITKGLQLLSSSSIAFDFLHNEPELYSVNDLKIRFT